jgi:hypothetical protein
VESRVESGERKVESGVCLVEWKVESGELKVETELFASLCML